MKEDVLRDTTATIHLDYLRDNIQKIKELAGSHVAIMAIVKANGYGHGAVGIAQTLLENHVNYLGVATLSEALELRSSYDDAPIFILGSTPDRLLPYVVNNDITQAIFNMRQGHLLNQYGQELNKRVKVHIKVDTGFHRLGFTPSQESLEEIKTVCSLPWIHAEGIFSHLALVNEAENKIQYDLFCQFVNSLEKTGISFRYKHISDSIATVDYPQYNLNMIRPGALVYGLKGKKAAIPQIRQILTVQTKISQVHKIGKGQGVGYDYLWRAEEDCLVGTLPFGYADGYPRNMRGKGYVTIKGQKAPIIGVICMDQCMVDLSGIPDVKEGDTAIIYGDGTENTMSIEEVANLAETNKNEIVSRISNRIPKIYVRQPE